MGLRCSLLGHDYGEPETTEEREERGNEEVVTVREFRQCGRCGAETVVSENTEVRRREPGRDEPGDGTAVEGDSDAEGTPAGAADGAGPADGTTESADGTADAIDEAEPSGQDGAGSAAPADGAGPSGPAVDDALAADSTGDDDAIILDGEADVRDTTQWPDDDQVEAADGPMGNGTGDGVAASSGAGTETVDDGTPPSRSDETPPAGDSTDAPEDGADAPEDRADAAGSPSDAGDWPDAADAGAGDDRAGEGLDPGSSPEADDAEPGADAGTGYVSAGSTGADDGARREAIDDVGITSTGPVGQAGESVDAVLVCPECGFSERAVASSLREGDICPEPDCGKGYLGEREP